MLIIFKIETIINNRKKNIYRMLIKRTFEKYYSNKLFYILNCNIYFAKTIRNAVANPCLYELLLKFA